MLTVLVIVQALEHLGDVGKKRGFVLDLRYAGTFDEAAHGREYRAVILDENFQLVVIVRPVGPHAFVQSPGKLLVGEVLDEHRVELLEERAESHDAAMSADSVNQGHELAVLFGKLVVDLLER